MKFFLFSLGCKVNGYETNALREQLLVAGFTECSSFHEADIIVINTCGVTHVADQKSRQHIRKFRRLAPSAILVVMGCYSEIHAKEVANMGADIIVGTSARNQIVTFIKEILDKKKTTPIIDVKKSVRHEKFEEMGQIALTNQARAYLKIQDGCDNFCAYCLIPTLRGNSRSRDKNNILLETKNLVEQGYKEIVLTGIHIGKYGSDFEESYDLFNLVEDILLENPSLYRLRLGSLESAEITPKFKKLLMRFPSIANHVHIPLQSGSSSVLARMHRPYDVEAFLDKVMMLREARDDIALTTDIIVGFPGESEEEWEETISFVKKAKFSQIHVFPFSPRSGTLAASMANQIDPQTKERRVHELIRVSKELQEEYESRFLGKEMEVLFEEDEPKKGISLGHTSNYLHVCVPFSKPLHGEIKTIIYRKENEVK